MAKPALAPTGALVAATLATSWRRSPAGPKITHDQLSAVAPLLLRSGAAALAWRCVSQTELSSSRPGVQLQLAYVYQRARAEGQERDLKEVLTSLHSAGIDPILIKGWAAARAYTQPGLRPYGDIDLVIPPQQYAKTQSVLDGLAGRPYKVDTGVGKHQWMWSSGRCLEDLYAHSQVVKLGEVRVRVPSPEDHLRLLCLHFLKHYGWRPLWLCDIAAALESRPPDFDWDRCLGGDRRQANWVAYAISLAHRLLAAVVDEVPIAREAQAPPAWVVREVENIWAAGHSKNYRPQSRMRAAMRAYLHPPSGAPKDLGKPWLSPFEATIYLRKPFDKMPRALFQLAGLLPLTITSMRRLPDLLRG